MESARAQIFQLFIRRFSLLALACILLLSIYLLDERRELLEHTKTLEITLINNASRDADHVMKRVLRDLLHLSKEIESGLSSRPGASMPIAETTRKFIIFSEIKPYFDQVRFLGMSGMEVIRINHSAAGIEVVPKERLQNKGDRYYFKDAISLKKGEVYISPLDLNIEGK